jgi:hypothetical protein
VQPGLALKGNGSGKNAQGNFEANLLVDSLSKQPFLT